jgi:hypothetical protein
MRICEIVDAGLLTMPLRTFSFSQPVGLGSRDWLNVDFLALLADSAAAARVVAAPP